MNNYDEHNPNPFDFVPFPEHPITKKTSEFDAMGELLSGYLELRIKALTPIHIVGSQRQSGNNRDSIHYRQNNSPCIPAASIRGCLRSFLEALTAGWVSQANPQYAKVYGRRNPKGRHRGFSTFNEKQGAISPEFKPRVLPGPEVDIASYLFGQVFEKADLATVAHTDLAWKSKVWVEDAYFHRNDLDSTKYWIPDIQGDAFMGGPKPSASSWWYMKPNRVEKRQVRLGGKILRMAEFIGENYRGRKFYFHQDPDKCVSYYDPGKGHWVYPTKPFCKINLVVLKRQALTDNFRIYLDRVPKQILVLFVLTLFPGSNIRHKIGYGKAYGFGSFEFELQKAYLRVEDGKARIPPALDNSLEFVQHCQSLAWDKIELKNTGVESLIDWQALDQLAIILGIEGYEDMTFTYPPFQKKYFQEGIDYRTYNGARNNPINGKLNMENIAQSLYPKKKTIDFRLYQEYAKWWHEIKNRKP